MDHTSKHILLPETEAHSFKSKAGCPSFPSETFAYTSDGTPIEYSYLFSNGDKSNFNIHFHPKFKKTEKEVTP